MARIDDLGRGRPNAISGRGQYGAAGSAPQARGVGNAAKPKSNSKAKIVDKPLTSAQKKQNTAAETYKTKTTVVSPAAAKARAAASERMKRQAKKAKNFNKAVGGAAAASAGVGYVAGYGDGSSKKEKKVSTVSEPNRRRMSDSRRKNVVKRNTAVAKKPKK